MSGCNIILSNLRNFYQLHWLFAWKFTYFTSEQYYTIVINNLQVVLVYLFTFLCIL